MAWKPSLTDDNIPNIGNVKSDLSQEIAQESSVLSEKRHDVNRAYQVRRDTDNQKNNTVTLLDIDTAIMRHLESLQLTVTDEGNQIKVPFYFSSPEKWVSIKTQGCIRDFNGKMILPVVVLQRTSSDKDKSMAMFNRYLNYPVMRQHSEKNRYTKFNILIGQNAPINEVYDIIMVKHMVFTYHFILWTEYIEQMNYLVEKFSFNTEDYWGELRGLRFRTKIESISHTVELQVDTDRFVKSEFDLLVNGYLLPDIMDKLAGKQMTTQKFFTPKKLIMGQETVMTEFNPVAPLPENAEKWRNQKYPNLQKDVPIIPPPFVQGNPLNTSGSILQ
jgi:hypothetical protein